MNKYDQYKLEEGEEDTPNECGWCGKHITKDEEFCSDAHELANNNS